MSKIIPPTSSLPPPTAIQRDIIRRQTNYWFWWAMTGASIPIIISFFIHLFNSGYTTFREMIGYSSLTMLAFAVHFSVAADYAIADYRTSFRSRGVWFNVSVVFTVAVMIGVGSITDRNLVRLDPKIPWIAALLFELTIVILSLRVCARSKAHLTWYIRQRSSNNGQGN